MRGWFETLVGPDYAGLAAWVSAIVVVALLLYAFSRIARRYSAGTYVAGGRNRKTRLAVMDAAAIDGHRRLVLVRRDDVEHLILIGGPTDVVVEQHIRATPRRGAPQEAERPAGPARPAEPAPTRPIEPVPALPSMQEAVPPTPAAPHRPRPSTPIRETLQPPPPSVAADTARPNPASTGAEPHGRTIRAATLPPLRMETPRPAPERAGEATASPPRRVAPLPLPGMSQQQPAPTSNPAETRETESGPTEPEFDDALLHELEATLDGTATADEPSPDQREVDDEMARLLGSLAPERS